MARRHLVAQRQRLEDGAEKTHLQSGQLPRASLELVLALHRIQSRSQEVLEDETDDRQEPDYSEISVLVAEGDAGGEQTRRKLHGDDRDVDLANAGRDRLTIDHGDVHR